MTHTKQFLQGMFAAYMGCEVINTDEGKHLKMIGISGYFISVYEPPYPFCESEGDEYEWMFSECKPILNPLSEITDEDAVEVAKIMTVATNCDWVGAGKNETIRFLHLLIIGNKENNDYDDNMALGFDVVAQIIDYLRSPFRPDGTPKPVYDCGYMHIQSLIQADLAISSKQI